MASLAIRTQLYAKATQAGSWRSKTPVSFPVPEVQFRMAYSGVKVPTHYQGSTLGFNAHDKQALSLYYLNT